MTDRSTRRRIALDTLPDTATAVAMHGALVRAEVGGSYCFGVVVAVTRSAYRPA